MLISELWWNNLVNSVLFLDDVYDALADNKSVLLQFDADIPWQEILINTIANRLAKDGNTDGTFERRDVSKDVKKIIAEKETTGNKETTDDKKKKDDKKMTVGEYLMNWTCTPQELYEFWPTEESREQYLANKCSKLQKKWYGCITGIPSEYASIWVSFIADYMKNCNESQKHGVFILICQGTKIPLSKYLSSFRYADYVTDYDCIMLCMTLVSNLSCSKAEKMYLCEVASNIADNRAEFAALLVSEKLSLIQNPIAVSENVCRENGIKIANLHDIVCRAVWEAQIKLVFPKLENFRAEIIRKYEPELQRFLPIRSSNNDTIYKAADLEIGQLFYVCKENRTSRITNLSDYEMLRKMRDARNILAHWEMLSYEQLKELDMI